MNLQAYRKAWQEAGHAGNGNVFLRVPVYAGVTEQGALEEPQGSIVYYCTRQANLQRLLSRRPDGIFVSDLEQGEIGPDLFRKACEFGLEGLVSKRAHQPYRGAGRNTG